MTIIHTLTATAMTTLSAPMASLVFDQKQIPDFFQYLFVAILVIVMFSMKEYVNRETNPIKDQLDDLQKKQPDSLRS